MEELSLLFLPEGSVGCIRSVGTVGPMRGRLMDLGFSPGENVTCLFSAPSGDPKAYMIKSSVIALRQKDAAQIYIKEV